MYTISTAAAAGTGARHLRVARNGQDAVATWTGEDCGAIVVCDGCGSGAFSEALERLLDTSGAGFARVAIARVDDHRERVLDSARRKQRLREGAGKACDDTKLAVRSHLLKRATDPREKRQMLGPSSKRARQCGSGYACVRSNSYH